MRFEPYEYQQYVIDRICEQKKLAVFLDMGLGKTACTLKAIDNLMNDYLEVNKVLIIAPLKVARLTWLEEIEKWDDFSHLRISRIVGTEKQRIKAIEKPADIYIVNRENTVWLYKYFKQEKRWPYQMIVIDESSSFKNHNSKRFKAARILTAVSERVICLAGTPVPNGLLDLWAQIYLLDSGERLGRTYTIYRDRYFIADQRNATTIFSYKLKYKMEPEIYNKIRDIAISMKAIDYIKMPERIDNVIAIEMNPKARDLYELMKHDYLITLDEEMITAASAGAVCQKLLQMANGAVYKADHTWALIHNLKLEALEEIIEENEGKPVLVFYNFIHDKERLVDYFKARNPRFLDSDTDKKEWDEGKIKLLLAHPASMGHGLNLQAGGNIIVWFGLTYNLEMYMQANARLYRQGQKETVVINHLVVSGTEDENAMAKLRGKALRQEDLIDAVKAEIRKAKEEI